MIFENVRILEEKVLNFGKMQGEGKSVSRYLKHITVLNGFSKKLQKTPLTSLMTSFMDDPLRIYFV